jgi:glutamate carboxypeptidase
MRERELLRVCERDLPWLLETIDRLVRLESPSGDEPALIRCASELARQCESLGARTTGAGAGAPLHVRAEVGQGPPRILVLGHLDTVWPVGALEVVRKDGRLYGPGAYDMKGGLGIGLQALRALLELDLLPGTVVLLCTTDEEIGSAGSRDLIEAEAREADAVLVLEPPLANGAVKTSRKGVGDFSIEITGVAAHAGVEPSRGASAIHELVRLAASVLALGRPEIGTTVNVGVVEGGTRSNVVAERASMAIDVRASSMVEAMRVDTGLRALSAGDPRISLTVRGGINRPPMERSEGVIRLYERARDVAAALGHDLLEGGTGGASDGNFTAALGIPTLDGLGAPGDGAHARHEHILVDALPFRSALLAGLIARSGEAGQTGA